MRIGPENESGKKLDVGLESMIKNHQCLLTFYHVVQKL